MPAKKIAAPQEIYQLKVTLLGTRPPIWRRLLVPAGLPMGQLHDILQAAMGWEDCHLHEFSIGRRRIGQPDPDFMGMEPSENESAVQLFTVFDTAGAKIRYTYDFGDDWDHDIVLEKRLPVDPNIVYPACTGGKRACPPEDCGGVGGFYELLDALSDPAKDQHEDMLDWIGGDYHPEAFSIDEVNQRLAPFQRRRGKASKS